MPQTHIFDNPLAPHNYFPTMLRTSTFLLLGPAVVLAWSPPPSSSLQISAYNSHISCARSSGSSRCHQQYYGKATTTSTSALHASHSFSSFGSRLASSTRRNPISRLLNKSTSTSKHSNNSNNISGSNNSNKQKSSALHNIVEDGLDLEIDEIEAELRMKKAINLRLTKIKDAQDDIREKSREPPPMKIKDAASIIAGTAIGGGFLALPSVTSPIGYGPTALGLVASWGFLLLSAFAFIEAAGLVSDARSRKEKSPTYKKDEDTEGGLAISSIIREAFGKRWGIVSGLAFIAQMIAVMTIQVVKGAAITSQLTGMPYAMGCPAGGGGGCQHESDGDDDRWICPPLRRGGHCWQCRCRIGRMLCASRLGKPPPNLQGHLVHPCSHEAVGMGRSHAFTDRAYS